MAKLSWRYVRWWVAEHKDTTLVITAPASVVVGLIGVVGAVVDTDLQLLWMGGVILLFGLFATLFPILRYRREVTEREP